MTPAPSRPSLGIALTIGAMAFFATADSLIKLATQSLSPAHAALLLMGGGGLVFIALALARQERFSLSDACHPVLLARYASEMLGAFGMVMALSHVPLTTVGAVLQASPLVVTLGAIWIFAEQVSWRRWLAIACGFVGVMMILRPGTEAFAWSTLYPVVAMVGLSLRDLATRATPQGIPTASMASYTMFANLPILLLWCWLAEGRLLPQGPIPWPPVIGMVGLGAVGYLLMTAAVRVAPLSVVIPFRYTRLVFLMLIGLIVFGERPDAWTYGGAAVIVASGLYALWRDRVRARERTA